MNVSKVQQMVGAVALSLAIAQAAAGCASSDDGVVAEGAADGQTVDDGEAAGSESSPSGQETSEGGAGGEAADGEGSATGGATTSRGDHLVATSIVGDPQEISTNQTKPDADRGMLTVDQAYTTDTFEDFEPPSNGSTFLVIEYGLQFTTRTTYGLDDTAFRLHIADETYETFHRIDVDGRFPGGINWDVVFEVPDGSTQVQLEAGIPAGTTGGLTATYDITLAPGDLSAVPGQGTGTVEADVAATSIEGGAQQTVGSFTANSGREVTVEPLAATITGRSGEVFAGDGMKVVAVDLKVSGVEWDFDFSTVRLRADGEWYQARVAGSVNDDFEDAVPFEVPREASEFLLEVGAPMTQVADNGFPLIDGVPDVAATWSIVFPPGS